MIFSMIHLVLISVIILAPSYLRDNPCTLVPLQEPVASDDTVLSADVLQYPLPTVLWQDSAADTHPFPLRLLLDEARRIWSDAVHCSGVLSFLGKTYSLTDQWHTKQPWGHGVCLHNSTGTIVHTSHVQSRSLLEGEKPSHKEFATYQEFQDDIIRNYYL